MSEPQPGTSSGGTGRRRGEDQVPLTGEDSHSSSSDEQERPQQPPASRGEEAEQVLVPEEYGGELFEAAVYGVFAVVRTSLEQTSKENGKLASVMTPPMPFRLLSSLRTSTVLKRSRGLLSPYKSSLDAIVAQMAAGNELATQISALKKILDKHRTQEQLEEERQKYRQMIEQYEAEYFHPAQDHSQPGCSGYVSLPSTSKQQAEARGGDREQFFEEVVSLDMGTESPTQTSPMSSDPPTALDTAGLSTVSTNLSADDQEEEEAASEQEKQREQEAAQERVDWPVLMSILIIAYEELDALLREHSNALNEMEDMERMDQLELVKQQLLAHERKLRCVLRALEEVFPHAEPPAEAAAAAQEPRQEPAARRTVRALLRRLFSRRRRRLPY